MSTLEVMVEELEQARNSGTGSGRGSPAIDEYPHSNERQRGTGYT